MYIIRKYRIKFLVFIIFISVLGFIFTGNYYFQKVHIYEPVIIQINNLSVKEKKSIRFYGISPLNKKFALIFNDTLNYWYYYYAFYNSISATIPDSVFLKIDLIDIKIGENNKRTNPKQLIPVSSSGITREYIFPKNICSEKSVFKMLASPFHWNVIRNLILIIITVLALLAGIMYFNKIWKYSRIIILKTQKFIGNCAGGSMKYSRIITNGIHKYVKINAGRIAECNKIVAGGLLKSVVFILKKFRQYCRIVIFTIKETAGRNFRKILKMIRIASKHILLLVKKVKWRKIKMVHLVIIILIPVLISLYLFYGYLFISWYYATYISSLLFIILCTAILYGILLLVFRLAKSPAICVRKVKISVIVFFLLWVITESLLRSAVHYKSYNERSGLPYISFYKIRENEIKGNVKFMIAPPHTKLLIKKKEFEYVHYYNGEGLRDKDYTKSKQKGEYRIICLGNSFTEGQGTPQDSTWPHLLDIKLKAYSNKICVMNAGTMGQDPFYEYMLLQDRMLKYNPDMLILALHPTDYIFHFLRGGFERFSKNGLAIRKGPAWEGLFALSYIFRWYITDIRHYNLLFYLPSEMKNKLLKAENDLYQCIYKFKDLSEKEHFKLVIVFIYIDHFLSEMETPFYAPIISKLKKNNDIPFIDLKEYLDKTEHTSHTNKYLWPLDLHYNSKGYDFMARGVEWKLKEMGVLDSLKSATRRALQPVRRPF